MRFLVSLPDDDAARNFAAYLLTRKIDATVEQGADGWSIWVHDDDKVAEAAAELEQFQRNPNDPRFVEAAKEAEEIRAFAEKHEERRRKNFIDVRTKWSRAAVGSYPLTLLLIVMSGVITASTNFGARTEIVNRFLFAPIHVTADGKEIYRLRTEKPAEDILHGEVWRAVTPIFIHFGIIHILFNMMWLYQLGSLIEMRKGTILLLGLVLVSAAISNSGQYAYAWQKGEVAPGLFGGMSGVVYALFGYVWMKQRYQPYEQMGLPPNTVAYMLVWLVVCMTGWIGPVANAAHFVGLVVGMAAGGLPTLLKRAMK